MKAARILEQVSEKIDKKDDRKSSTQPRVDWEEEKTFTGEHLAIKLLRLPLRRPKFKWEILFRGRSPDQIFRGQIIEARGQGKVEVHAPFWHTELDDLRGQMMQYTQEYLQRLEDERVSSQQAWEERKYTKREPPKRGTKGKG